MGQQSWTMVDDFGGIYDIGLYHGERSKHVIIHINRFPVIVEFNIKESKKYSFYAGHELCEIDLKKHQTGYSYTFEINKTSNTPLNKARHIQNRKYLIIIAILLLILICSIIWATIYFSKFFPPIDHIVR